MIKFRNYIRDYLKDTDLVLLIFLLLFLNVKIIVKLLALIFIYIVRPSFQFGFRFKNSRLPLFYPVVLLIGLVNYFLLAGFTNINYSISFLTGIAFWVFCILAIQQVKLATERSTVAQVHRAIILFLLLNVTVSGINLMRIIIETGEWNPYTYQGLYQKYFIGTGDYIKGITLDTSTTNAVLNAFGVFYFLTRQKFFAALLCMAALLLTCSNFVNLTVILVFIYCLLFQGTRDQKSIIVVCIAMLVIFMAKISPQNDDYAIRTFEKIFKGRVSQKLNPVFIPIELRPDSILSADEKKYKLAKILLNNWAATIDEKSSNLRADKNLTLARPSLPVANIHTAPYQHKQDSSAARLQVIHFAMRFGRDTSTQLVNAQKLPGKLLAAKQTADYFAAHPSRIILGTGMGNFSSKLAFRTTGLQVAGGYPERFIYINDDFRNNQLAIFLDYFGKDSGFHSITNTPNSVYVQLLSEYGVAGLLALFFLYGWFFAKNAQRKSYVILILLIVTAVFFADYWFEQLSILVLFELLVFLHQKEKKETAA